MPIPKSVTKISVKSGSTNLQFTDFSDQASYLIHELTRAALRDVGKYISKSWKSIFYSYFKKHSGDASKAVNYYVIANAKTTAPRVQVGLKTGKVDGFYAYFQEFGTSKTKRLGLLQKSVKDNISQIVEIESKYLSGLSGEAEALASQINENAYEENDE